MLATVCSQHNPAKFSGEEKNRYVSDSVKGLCSFHDTVDKPEILKIVGHPSKLEESIFQKMKYECNRQYSFKGKWPKKEVTPESLAAAGLFYLQHEDKVQCPFCEVIIYNWTPGDNPLGEHIKKSPKCPFLIGADVGNIPLIARKNRPVPKNIVRESQTPSSSTSAIYKPQHPRMADVKRRLLTYSGWQLRKPTPQQLAECGLYYTGMC